MAVTLPLFVADAFTNKPFRGNSAAVCLLPFDQHFQDPVLQNIAAEMNLSETAFLRAMKKEDTFENGKEFHLRWFTPKLEVPLCGHATLASSAVLFSQYLGNKSDVITFHTLGGILRAKKMPCGKIELDFPAIEYDSVPGKYEKLVKTIVGNLPVCDVVLSHSKKLLIRLDDNVTREEMERVETNDLKILAIETDVVGVILTLKSTSDEFDFRSRYFAPWNGIREDPVTGSAHCVLAPYWAKVLKKTVFNARQGSFRQGELEVELLGDRVFLRGNAVVVHNGQIHF